MRRISFNTRFVNESGDDLIPGKIHTIRQNFDFWKRFEGKDVALFTWVGAPYRSKQKVFCEKRLVSVQEMEFKTKEVGSIKNIGVQLHQMEFFIAGLRIPLDVLAENDGFKEDVDLMRWFLSKRYKPGKMAVLHFTDFKYEG